MRLVKLSLVTAFAVALALSTASRVRVSSQTATEAPAACDNKPVPGFFAGTTAQQQAEFNGVKAAFEEVDVIADGLGPVYNAQSCAECHQNPVTGGISQITEFRAGHLDAFGNAVDAPGGPPPRPSPPSAPRSTSSATASSRPSPTRPCRTSPPRSRARAATR